MRGLLIGGSVARCIPSIRLSVCMSVPHKLTLNNGTSQEVHIWWRYSSFRRVCYKTNCPARP